MSGQVFWKCVRTGHNFQFSQGLLHSGRDFIGWLCSRIGQACNNEVATDSRLDVGGGEGRRV